MLRARSVAWSRKSSWELAGVPYPAAAGSMPATGTVTVSESGTPPCMQVRATGVSSAPNATARAFAPTYAGGRAHPHAAICSGE